MNDEDDLKMPEALDGFHATLNNTGWMTAALDPYSQAFVDYVPQACGPSLEIGAAYGVATVEVLKRGFAITANDLDSRHLSILKNRVPAEFLQNLLLLPGAFPDGIPLMPEEFGAILACRILHFFDGPTLVRGLRRLASALLPGGKLFMVVESPYHGVTKSGLVKIYEERKNQGEEWPGYFDNIRNFVPPEKAATCPPVLHFLDPDILIRVGKLVGLEVEKAGYIGRPDYPSFARFDGRENVGIILVK
jgi:SAM-dependent methyltransferase